MAVSLPYLPLPWAAEASLIDFGVDQSAGAQGPRQRSTRLGSRWSVKFSALPGLGWTYAQQFLAARLAAAASGSTVIVPWPQPAFATPVGAPVVDGAGQGGNALKARGFSAGAVLPAGLFFSLAVSGRNYLYMLTDPVTADGAGKASLPIAPWIRALPADAAALSFAAPQIEGFIDTGDVAWTLDMLAWVGLPAFTVTEIA